MTRIRSSPRKGAAYEDSAHEAMTNEQAGEEQKRDGGVDGRELTRHPTLQHHCDQENMMGG